MAVMMGGPGAMPTVARAVPPPKMASSCAVTCEEPMAWPYT